MKAKLLMIIFPLLPLTNLQAQQLTYTPDFVLGHRSYTYMHNVNYQLNEKWKINNLTLFDTEYTKDKENIFFIRNTLSYNVSKRFILNGAFGMKNPGAFFSAFAQYRVAKPTYSFSYSLGTTYQAGFTLEQSVSFEYLPYITNQMQGYFNVLAIGNIDNDGYQRGLQFLRLGIKQDKMIYGFASNFDQFNNAKKNLENIGLFIKYSF